MSFKQNHLCDQQVQEMTRFSDFDHVRRLCSKYHHNLYYNEIEEKRDKNRIIFELQKLVRGVFRSTFHNSTVRTSRTNLMTAGGIFTKHRRSAF